MFSEVHLNSDDSFIEHVSINNSNAFTINFAQIDEGIVQSFLAFSEVNDADKVTNIIH